MRCPYCETEEYVTKNGRSNGKKRMYRCRKCRKNFVSASNKHKHCRRCGYPLTNGKCTECFQPLIQYHNIDREVKLYI